MVMVGVYSPIQDVCVIQSTPIPHLDMETVMTMIEVYPGAVERCNGKDDNCDGIGDQRMLRDVLDITEIKTVMDLVALGVPNAFVPQLLRMIRPIETIATTMIQRLIQRLWRSVTV